MNQNLVLWVGGALVGLSLFFYAATWATMVLKPGWLLGNVTMLWLRTLVRTLTAGLILILLFELNEIVRTILFWRN
jgi:hypothetical protein